VGPNIGEEKVKNILHW